MRKWNASPAKYFASNKYIHVISRSIHKYRSIPCMAPFLVLSVIFIQTKIAFR